MWHFKREFQGVSAARESSDLTQENCAESVNNLRAPKSVDLNATSPALKVLAICLIYSGEFRFLKAGFLLSLFLSVSLFLPQQPMSILHQQLHHQQQQQQQQQQVTTHSSPHQFNFYDADNPYTRWLQSNDVISYSGER